MLALACKQTSDILLRGYVGYLDCWLIRKASVCSEQGFRPGWFTHAALYASMHRDLRKHPRPMPEPA